MTQQSAASRSPSERPRVQMPRPLSRLGNRLPAVIWIECRHLRGGVRIRSQILLVDGTVVTGKEGHNAGERVFRRPGDNGKSTDHRVAGHVTVGTPPGAF